VALQPTQIRSTRASGRDDSTKEHPMRIQTCLAMAITGCIAVTALADDHDRKHAKDGVRDGTAMTADRVGLLPNGITARELNDQQDVRAVLAAATNAAVTNGGFDDLIERLSTKDRERIGDFAEQEFAEIDGRVDQIRKNWEQKYGSSFNLDNARLFEGFVQVTEGEVSDASTARQHWPVHARPAREDTRAASSNEYIENGRNVAIVQVPASHDLPAITISMIHEPVDDWRIDLPDSITGQMIHDNVKSALTTLGDNVASWPADVNEAYRAVGHRLLMAVCDVPHEEPKSAVLDNR